MERVMRQVVAGKRLSIEGKEVMCPPAPLFMVKAFGQVVNIVQQDRAQAHASFDQLASMDRELWELDRKHMWRLVRRMFGGMEKGKQS
jgi:hypothetical protein